MEKNKEGKFKIDSDMINLVGCNKENFYKLLELMEYVKSKTNNEEEFFAYKPKYIKNKKITKKKNTSNPFDKLSELRLR